MGSAKRALLLLSAGGGLALALTAVIYLVRPLRVDAPGETTETPVSSTAPSGRVTLPRRVSPYGRVVALVIGINEYPRVFPRRDLVKAEPEAEAIGKVFEDVFGYEVVTLLGRKATRASVIETIDRYGREVGADDALIIYFAGHGQVIELPRSGEAGFLVPQDAALDIRNTTNFPLWEEQAINMKAVVEQINRMPAKHVLLIADACCSGFLTTAKRGALSDPEVKNFIANPARTVLVSTTRSQIAEDGKFTPELVKLLKGLGQAGSTSSVASVYDLFQPLLREVSRASRGTMTPQMAQVSEGDGVFVFVPVSVPKDVIDAALRDVIVKRQQMLKEFTAPAEVYALTATIDYRGASDAESQQRIWDGRFERFRRNAELGDVWAMAALHYCHSVGLGTGKNPGMAYHWARQVARANWPAGVGTFLLGRCYELGLGVSTDPANFRATATRLYKESCEAGSPLGRYAVGKSLLRQKDPAEADIFTGIEHLEAAEKEGVLEAKVELAYQIGKWRIVDEKKSHLVVPLLEVAAASGSAHALYLLYKLNVIEFQRSAAKKPDDTKREAAKKYLLAAADRGHPTALLYLGYHYLNKVVGDSGSLKLIPRRGLDRWIGRADVGERADRIRIGISADGDKGRECWLRAAEIGEPTAMILIGLMHKTGDGVPADSVQAKAWIEKAVEGKDTEGYFVKGLLCLGGEVYAQDDAAAFKYLKLAADNGHPAANCAAGIMYLNERGVAKPFPLDGGGATMSEYLDGPIYKHWAESLHHFAKSLATAEGTPVYNVEPFLVAHEYLEDFAILLELDKPRSERRGDRTITHIKDKRLHDKLIDIAKAGRPFKYSDATDKVKARWRSDYPETYSFFEANYLKSKK